jgi:hypothetical protein
MRGRLCTIDHLVLTSLDQLILILKILFSFFTKQATLMRRSTSLSLPPQLVFPGITVTEKDVVKVVVHRTVVQHSPLYPKVEDSHRHQDT